MSGRPQPPVVVVDASFAISLIRPESGTPAARESIALWQGAGVRLLVPDHFWLEITNSLAKRGATSAEMLEGVYELDELGLETVAVDRPLLLTAIDAMEQHRLTSYDATYLALAETIEGGLATWDTALRSAAPSRVLPPDGLAARLSESPAPYATKPTWPEWPGARAYLARLRAEALAGERG